MWFVVLTYLFIAIPLGTIFNGFVLSKLWLWFVVPVFPTPVLPVVVACGISLIVSYLTIQVDLNKNTGKELPEVLTDSINIMISKPLAALFVGYILSLFI